MQRRRSDGSFEYAAVKFIRVPAMPENTQELLGRGYSKDSIRQKYQQDANELKKEYVFMDKLKGEPNIVHCDAFAVVPLKNEELGCCLLIKMELLTPLEKVILQSYSERQVISLGMDICKALAACKKYDIIHRDIKPANIMVSNDGRFYKLGDFGVSKIQEHTASGTKTGSWGFMAPEVYNNKKYNASVDIYSLGMVLYWMMNQRCEPFLPLPPAIPTAGELQHARMRRFNGELLPMPANGSIALKNAVLRACDPNPKNRFESPEEMYNTLSAIPVVSDSGVDGSYHYSYTRDDKKASGSGGKNKARRDTRQNAGPQSGGTAGREQENQQRKNVYTSLDVRITLKLTREEAANGCQKTVAIPGGRKIKVSIPKGSDKHPTELRLQGMGKEDPATGAKGTLYVKLEVTDDFWDGDSKIHVNEDAVYLSPKDNRGEAVTFRMYQPTHQPIKVLIPPHTAEKDNPVDAKGYIVDSQGEILDPSMEPFALKINTILIKKPDDIQKTPDSVLQRRMALAVHKKGFKYYFYLLLVVLCIVGAIATLCEGLISLSLMEAGVAGLFYVMHIKPPSASTQKNAADAKEELVRRYRLWVH